MEISHPQKRRRTSEDHYLVATKRPTLHPRNDMMELRATTTETIRALNPVHIEPEELRSQIQEVVDNALSNDFRHYANVRCLLISWEEDNLGCIQEINDLHNVLSHSYAFKCDSFQLPSKDSERQLRLKLNHFDSITEETDLFIVYYGGHAEQPGTDSEDFYWTATEESTAPFLNWARLQCTVEQMPSDALLILDCCYAAHAARGAIPKKKEVLAASGWDATAVGGVKSKSSFTAFLIEELKYFSGLAQPFTVSQLYTHMIRNKHGPNGKSLIRTPFFCQLPCQDTRRQIVLCPRPEITGLTAQTHAPSLHFSNIAAYPRMVVTIAFSKGFENKTAQDIGKWLTT
jgi:hypothetical protein